MHDLALASSCMRRSRRGSGYEICRSELLPLLLLLVVGKRLSLRDGPTSQMRRVSLADDVDCRSLGRVARYGGGRPDTMGGGRSVCVSDIRLL
jgi:hypothetical protein